MTTSDVDILKTQINFGIDFNTDPDTKKEFPLMLVMDTPEMKVTRPTNVEELRNIRKKIDAIIEEFPLVKDGKIGNWKFDPGMLGFNEGRNPKK